MMMKLCVLYEHDSIFVTPLLQSLGNFVYCSEPDLPAAIPDLPDQQPDSQEVGDNVVDSSLSPPPSSPEPQSGAEDEDPAVEGSTETEPQYVLNGPYLIERPAPIAMSETARLWGVPLWAYYATAAAALLITVVMCACCCCRSCIKASCGFDPCCCSSSASSGSSERDHDARAYDSVMQKMVDQVRIRP